MSEKGTATKPTCLILTMAVAVACGWASTARGQQSPGPATRPADDATTGRLARLWDNLGGSDAQVSASALRDLLRLCPSIPGEPVRWAADRGGNGHWYMAVRKWTTWADANAAATAAGGYLATIGSAEENAFVFDLVDDDRRFWDDSNPNNRHGHGPWLGGVQSPDARRPKEGWGWPTGETFIYTNWARGQPNSDRGTNQDRMHFLGDGKLMGPTWNDLHAEAGMAGYVIEAKARPVLPVGVVPGRDNILATFLAKKFVGPALDKGKVDRLILLLDDDAWPVRDKADKALRKMGAPVAPLLNEALKTTRSAEVKMRLEEILLSFADGARTPGAARQIRWAARMLELIASREALTALQRLAVLAPTGKVGDQVKSALTSVAGSLIEGHLAKARDKAKTGDVKAVEECLREAVAVATSGGHHMQGRLANTLRSVREEEKRTWAKLLGVVAPKSTNPLAERR